MQDHVVVDLQHDDPKQGDVYVLCSDGLSGMVSDDDMRQIIGSTNDVRDACRRLIQRANERGGEDNITAVLIKIEQQDEVVKTDPEPKEAAKEPEKVAPEETPGSGAKDKTGT
jgi:protein phosphatase